MCLCIEEMLCCETKTQLESSLRFSLSSVSLGIRVRCRAVGYPVAFPQVTARKSNQDSNCSATSATTEVQNSIFQTHIHTQTHTREIMKAVKFIFYLCTTQGSTLSYSLWELYLDSWPYGLTKRSSSYRWNVPWHQNNRKHWGMMWTHEMM